MFGIGEPYCQYVNPRRSRTGEPELCVQLTRPPTLLFPKNTQPQTTIHQEAIRTNLSTVTPRSHSLTEGLSSLYIQKLYSTYVENLGLLQQAGSTLPPREQVQPFCRPHPPKLLILFHCTFWTSWPVTSKMQPVLSSF